MGNKVYERKAKGDKPVIAICYDFDKTLSPTDMQAQGFIQEVGYDVKEFWEKSNGLAEDNDMDQNLAYMYIMRTEAAGRVLFTKHELKKYGEKVELFPGVEDWFERINAYGKTKDVLVEHYIISSGLKEMIEGTQLAQKGVFTKIYASSFYYDRKGVAVWPAQVVNYTNKTQYLFRIEKGTLDVNDPGVNEYFPPDERRIPFRNMIYIGDSDTDIPCMRLVNSYGGHAIGVYDAKTNNRSKVYKMLRDNRIKYFAKADYSDGSELDSLIKLIIDRTAFNEKLEEFYYNNLKEVQSSEKEISEEQQLKEQLINKLEESSSFAATHTIIANMNSVEEWSAKEVERICKIASTNDQVRYVIGDNDILKFLSRIIRKANAAGTYSKRISDIIRR